MEISVYPVPTNGLATISIKMPNTISFATSIYDMSGKLVYATEMNGYVAGQNLINVPLHNVSSGNYFYALTDKDGNLLASGKIVKR